MLSISALRTGSLQRAASHVPVATSASRAGFATSSSRLAAPSGPAPLYNTVQITRLPLDTNEKQLRKVMQKKFAGTITSVQLKHISPSNDSPARCKALVTYSSPAEARKVVEARRASGNALPRPWQNRRVFFNVLPMYGSAPRPWAFVKHSGQPGDVTAKHLSEAFKVDVNDIDMFGTSAVVKFASAERVKELISSSKRKPLVAGATQISVEPSTSWPPPPSRTLRYTRPEGSDAQPENLFAEFQSVIEKMTPIPPTFRSGTILFKNIRAATRALNTLSQPSATAQLQLHYVPTVEPSPAAK